MGWDAIWSGLAVALLWVVCSYFKLEHISKDLAEVYGKLQGIGQALAHGLLGDLIEAWKLQSPFGINQTNEPSSQPSVQSNATSAVQSAPSERSCRPAMADLTPSAVDCFVGSELARVNHLNCHGPTALEEALRASGFSTYNAAQLAQQCSVDAWGNINILDPTPLGAFLAQVEKSFHTFDHDNNGRLDIREVAAALEENGMDAGDVTFVFPRFDASDQGSLDKDQFLAYVLFIRTASAHFGSLSAKSRNTKAVLTLDQFIKVAMLAESA